MDKRLRWAALGVGALVLLAGVFALGRASSNDRVAVAAASSTSSSVAASATTVQPGTTLGSGTTAVAGPTSVPKPAPGTIVTGAGSLLQPAPQPTVQSTLGPNVDCHKLADAGWTADCARVDTVGGTRIWLTESKPAGALKAWRVYVLHFSQGKGAWLVDLRHTDEGIGAGLVDVKVLATDLTADGKPELVFGFRHGGSGSILAYDIVVDAAGGDPKVAASRNLSHGSATVKGGLIVDYEAKYPNGEPNCCPGYVQESVVQYISGNFRLVEGARQPPATATVGKDL